MANRIQSVDALRGLTVAAMLLVNNPGDWGHVYAPLQHAAWHGMTPTDLIFPLFLFIVGVSLSLSLGPRLEAGHDRDRLRRDVLARALRIVVLGLVLHAAAHWAMDTRAFRPFGVLQRIGLCFAAAGWLALHARARTQWGAIAALLLGTWALLLMGGSLSKEGNLASRLDAALLGRFAYEFDAATGLGHEPEGLLSTLPAIATTLLGVRAGDWLRHGQSTWLWRTGAAALLAGGLWSTVLPINKQLWTPSYVLWTGGWALLALWLAHHLIDRRGVPALGRSLGVNAIVVYAGSWLLMCALAGLGWAGPLYRHGFAWLAPHTGPGFPSFVYAVSFVALWWLWAAALDRRKLYFKV